MDTTEQYKKMCEAAQEIQKLWKWQIGDYYYSTTLKETHVAKGNNLIGMWDTEHENGMWLPRQDQLQDMVNFLSWDEFDTQCLRTARQHFIKTKIQSSKEQAGLMTVMMQNFGKTWNENKWIEQ